MNKHILSERTSSIRRLFFTESLTPSHILRIHTRFRSPSEAHSTLAYSAAITPPATLCKNSFKVYLLFLIGLIYYITAWAGCQLSVFNKFILSLRAFSLKIKKQTPLTREMPASCYCLIMTFCVLRRILRGKRLQQRTR